MEVKMKCIAACALCSASLCAGAADMLQIPSLSGYLGENAMKRVELDTPAPVLSRPWPGRAGNAGVSRIEAGQSVTAAQNAGPAVRESEERQGAGEKLRQEALRSAAEGDMAMAQWKLEQSVKAGNMQARMDLGILAAARGQNQKAFEALDGTDYPLSQQAFGVLYALACSKMDAKDKLEWLARKAERSPGEDFALAMAHSQMQLGKLSEAMETYKALALGSDSAKGALGWAAAALALGDAEQAIKAAELADRSNPALSGLSETITKYARSLSQRK